MNRIRMHILRANGWGKVRRKLTSTLKLVSPTKLLPSAKKLSEKDSVVKGSKKRLDTDSCIYTSVDISAEALRARIEATPRLNFIHFNNGDAATASDSIITLSRKNPAIKETLIVAANAGFHLYAHRDNQSSMVRHRRIASLWKNIASGEKLRNENGIFYTVETAMGAGEPRLLVIFSSIAAKMYMPSLMRHFEHNFSSIRKYVPVNTHILRIADMGGVVGSFYLNSNALPSNEDNIRQRIESTAADLGVSKDAIVVYGASKGGTAAVFYALRFGWRGVAVDPILSDAHYVEKYKDLHFTIGTFPATKQERFADLVQSPHPDAKLSVVCSSRSPQFPYIRETLIDQFQDKFLFLNSENAGIRSHPDVGRKTIPHALSQINLHLAGLELPAGMHTVW